MSAPSQPVFSYECNPKNLSREKFMSVINLIQRVREKKKTAVLSSLKQMFKDGSYPLCLVDACATGLNRGCDLRIASSTNQLDPNTTDSMQMPSQAPQVRIKAHRQTGITLVEILIAMLIGAFLIGGVLQIFLNTRQTYRMQEALSRLQENGRFALDFLSKDIRMAGFFGCSSRSFDIANVENELKDPSNFAWDITTPVQGFDDVSAGFTTVANVVPGTDVIVLRGLSNGSTPLISPFSDSAQMFVDTSFNSDCPAASSNTCHEGEILMVTDCTQGTLFQATQTTPIGAGSGVNVVHSATATFTPGNNSPATFTKSYGDGSQIAKLNTFAYYIRLNGAGVRSLYRSRINVTGSSVNALLAEELVEGIENMQVFYGEDTDADGTANYYVAAGTAGLDMNQVVSIRISLLARTLDDNITHEPLAYTYNGAATTPADRRLRRVFSSTIAVRNRLP